MSDGGLRQLFARHLPEAMWVTIETGSTGRGIPDAEYCFPGGVAGWVEFKLTAGWAVDMRPEQVAWLDRRSRAGGRCHVAVRRRAMAGPRRGAAADELWLFHGADARALMVEGIHAAGPGDPEPLVFCSGGPARWDWGAVRDALTR